MNIISISILVSRYHATGMKKHHTTSGGCYDRYYPLFYGTGTVLQQFTTKMEETTSLFSNSLHCPRLNYQYTPSSSTSGGQRCHLLYMHVKLSLECCSTNMNMSLMQSLIVIVPTCSRSTVIPFGLFSAQALCPPSMRSHQRWPYWRWHRHH